MTAPLLLSFIGGFAIGVIVESARYSIVRRAAVNRERLAARQRAAEERCYRNDRDLQRLERNISDVSMRVELVVVAAKAAKEVKS